MFTSISQHSSQFIAFIDVNVFHLPYSHAKHTLSTCNNCVYHLLLLSGIAWQHLLFLARISLHCVGTTFLQPPFWMAGLCHGPIQSTVPILIGEMLENIYMHVHDLKLLTCLVILDAEYYTAPLPQEMNIKLTWACISSNEGKTPGFVV